MLSSAPGMRVQPGDDRDLLIAARNEPKPIPLADDGGVMQLGAAIPPEEASTVVVCGLIGREMFLANPTLRDS